MTITKSQTNEQERLSPEILLEISYQVGRAFRCMPQKQAEMLMRDKKNFQKILQRISKEFQLPFQTEKVLLQLPKLEQYLNEILDLKIPEIWELVYPEKMRFDTLMVNPIQINEDQIMECYESKFEDANIYRYKKPIVGNIENKQDRPVGPYPFLYKNGDGPDTVHLGKSYNVFIKESVPFANAKEYLLMTGFKKFNENHFMDIKGWTRTTSLWSDGRLAGGCFDSNNSGLYMGNVGVADSSSDRGPRELVLS